MTIVGLDDTDSRTHGMCTTYLGTRVGERIAAVGGTVHRQLLIRLNPAVEHKTRGNAAVAIHADVPADEAFAIARDELRELAIAGDARTSPGLVVASGNHDDFEVTAEWVPADVAAFSRRALRERLGVAEALELVDAHDWREYGDAGEGCETVGRGRIGALAAIGAPAAFDDWTAERIAYREFDRCGTPREVDIDSVFAAADWGYPTVWDTVDRGEREPVCVPNAPGPILYGIRGDDPDACRAVADRIESEPVDRAATFRTNQGTDAHIAPGAIGDLRDGAGYRVDCVVVSPPETRRGGHVFFSLAHPADVTVGDGGSVDLAADARLATGAAFEPTKRFRDRVRALRPGDRLTVCGEYEESDDGVDGGSSGEATIKLEKFAVRELVRAERVTPTCPDCDRSMSSAGRNQGYRCRDCGTHADGKPLRGIDRKLECGWYEVPPCARRHVAKPLIRGGFDAPTHPER